LTATCLQSCKHDPQIPVPTNTTNNNTGGTTTAASFTIDLTDPANAALKNNGGYIIKNGIVIAKDMSGNYVAATQTCSHAGRVQVIFSSAQNGFYCPAHGAIFSIDGTGQNTAARSGLKTYKTALETTLLRIFY
jgi:cytochrome b6-f complex iron-sulfur subunit